MKCMNCDNYMIRDSTDPLQWWCLACGDAHHEGMPIPDEAFMEYDDEDYSDYSHEYDIDMPEFGKQERVFLDGLFYDICVDVYSDGKIVIRTSPVEYTCWDGKLPF